MFRSLMSLLPMVYQGFVRKHEEHAFDHEYITSFNDILTNGVPCA